MLQVDLYTAINMQLSVDKLLIFGYSDWEVTKVKAYPSSTIDTIAFAVKLNSLLEVLLPRILEPIDLKPLLKEMLASIDILDD